MRPQRAGVAARVPNRAEVDTGGVVLGLGAVSYTHLRAHETVLDLVCRLLLEKKKYTLNHRVCYFIWSRA